MLVMVSIPKEEKNESMGRESGLQKKKEERAFGFRAEGHGLDPFRGKESISSWQL